VNVVVHYKWTQRDASRAYGVPRKVLHDRLKENSQYKSRTTYRSYTQADMDEAVRLVTEENMPQRAAAKLFGIPRATLHGYVLRDESSASNSNNNSLLPHEQILQYGLAVADANGNFDNEVEEEGLEYILLFRSLLSIHQETKI